MILRLELEAETDISSNQMLLLLIPSPEYVFSILWISIYKAREQILLILTHEDAKTF